MDLVRDWATIEVLIEPSFCMRAVGISISPVVPKSDAIEDIEQTINKEYNVRLYISEDDIFYAFTKQQHLVLF